MFRSKAQRGDKVSDRDCLNSGIMSLVRWQRLRSLLVSNNWIVVTENGSYTLCRDLNAVTLWEVASLVGMPLNEPVPDEDQLDVDTHVSVWLGDFIQRRKGIETFAKKGFDISLEALFSQKLKSDEPVDNPGSSET